MKPTKALGLSRSAAYFRWQSMIQRCSNPNNPRWAHYGGRGIAVCDRWRESFLNFYEDVGDAPPGLTFDRIDNDGDYTPTNWRWATYSEQNRNRRKRTHLCGGPLVNSRKTHCKRGHEFDEANTYYGPDGGRRCRACRNLREREARLSGVAA